MWLFLGSNGTNINKFTVGWDATVGMRQEVLLKWKGVCKLGGKGGKSTPAQDWCNHYVFEFRLKLCFTRGEQQKHPGKAGLWRGFRSTVCLISESHPPFSTELRWLLKAAAANGGFVPAASLHSLQAVATQGEKQLTFLSWWLMTKMGCLKAFPNLGRRWWWWGRRCNDSCLGLISHGGKNFQVPLTPEMLHPRAKASTQ